MVIDVVAEGSERPPEGSPLVVRVLDTTYADAPAQLIAEVKTRVPAGRGAFLQSVELLAVARGANEYTVRAHVDVDGDGEVSSGDYVSTAAYPVRGDEPVQIIVRKV